MANHSRGEWSNVGASFARMGTADGVAVHHTASVPQGFHYDASYLRRIEQGEIAAGYSALAYHTMWFDDGDSAESRPYGSMGAATGGHNGHTIAMCYVGYCHPPYYHIPSDAMCVAMAREIYWLREHGFLTWGAPVLPHGEWTRGTQWATACCGETFIPKVGWIDEMSRSASGPPPAATLPARSDMDAIYATFPDGHSELIVKSGAQILYDLHGPTMPAFGGIPDNPYTSYALNGSGEARHQIPIRQHHPDQLTIARQVWWNTLHPPTGGGGGSTPIDYAALAKAVNDDAAARMKA